MNEWRKEQKMEENDGTKRIKENERKKKEKIEDDNGIGEWMMGVRKSMIVKEERIKEEEKRRREWMKE